MNIFQVVNNILRLFKKVKNSVIIVKKVMFPKKTEYVFLFLQLLNLTLN